LPEIETLPASKRLPPRPWDAKAVEAWLDENGHEPFNVVWMSGLYFFCGLIAVVLFRSCMP
jgi:hypothetical protein